MACLLHGMLWHVSACLLLCAKPLLCSLRIPMSVTLIPVTLIMPICNRQLKLGSVLVSFFSRFACMDCLVLR